VRSRLLRKAFFKIAFLERAEKRERRKRTFRAISETHTHYDFFVLYKGHNFLIKYIEYGRKMSCFAKNGTFGCATTDKNLTLQEKIL